MINQSPVFDETFLPEVRQWIEEKTGELTEYSTAVWNHPEQAFEEHFALKSQLELLEKWGFSPEVAVYGLETSYQGWDIKL